MSPTSADDKLRPDRGRLRRIGAAIVGFANGFAVVVAALAAVVGLGFLLTDRFAPGSSAPDADGAEQTALMTRYERDVADICDTLNEESKKVAVHANLLRVRMRRVLTTQSQRDLLLDAQNEVVGLSTEVLARFDALEPPLPLLSSHRAVLRTWDESLEHQSNYAKRLDQSRSRQDLRRAIRAFARVRPRLRRNSQAVRTGLTRLGAGRCRLEYRLFRRAVKIPEPGEPLLPSAAPGPVPLPVPGSPQPPPNPTLPPRERCIGLLC